MSDPVEKAKERNDLRRAIIAAKTTTRAKVLAIYLLDLQGEDGFAWPAWSTICRDCAMSRRTVTKAMAELEASNILHTDRPEHPANKRTNHYTINADRSTWVDQSTRVDSDQSTRVGTIGSLIGSKIGSGGERKQTPETIAAAAWQTVRAANNRPPTFLSFFENQILGRWDKYAVTPVIVDDWQALYDEHGEDRLSKAIAAHKQKSARWEPEPAEVVKLLPRKTAAEAYAEVEARDAERRQRQAELDAAKAADPQAWNMRENMQAMRAAR